MEEENSTTEPNFKLITLKSSDGQGFQIDTKSAEKSKVLKELIQDYQEDSEIPLPEVEGKILKKIVEYLIHYKDLVPKEIPKPLRDAKLNDIIDQWDINFIYGFTIADCIMLINGANYLDIQSLLHLGCARIASKMIELPIEEVRKTFNIEDDMTKEEKEMYDQYPLDTL